MRQRSGLMLMDRILLVLLLFMRTWVGWIAMFPNSTAVLWARLKLLDAWRVEGSMSLLFLTPQGDIIQSLHQFSNAAWERTTASKHIKPRLKPWSFCRVFKRGKNWLQREALSKELVALEKAWKACETAATCCVDPNFAFRVKEEIVKLPDSPFGTTVECL